MYRMIQMHPDHADYQRIVWRENIEHPMKTFRLMTLTYGTKPASFIATRCLKELADRNKDKYPEAAAIVARDFYMDDLLTGSDSIGHLSVLRDQIIDILSQGNFNLRKWASNQRSLIPDSLANEADLNVRLDKNEYTKTLGLFWNPSSDFLKYEVKNTAIPDQVTKRRILSRTAQIFDPLGLVAPVIVKAKIILQHLWSLKVDWDEPVPYHIARAWTQLLQELYYLNNINIPRNVIQLTPTSIQLHGFGDASQVAYGAAVYLRTTDANGNHGTHLLCAKSRVAPLRTISLPRLELAAALLLSQLVHNLLQTLNLPIEQKFFWSDSTIVLSWIKSTPALYQTFVANRIAEIQEYTLSSEWRHVRSESNPADVLSRGALPEELRTHDLWWNGPD